jgi:prophage maintenance system killer protein
VKTLEWIDERTGRAVAILFLELSGYRFTASEETRGGEA